jgi:hypothetical protein
MTSRNELLAILNTHLAPMGFARRRSTWYRATEDLVQAVNLQKSQWGNQYYLNVGIWIVALGRSSSPALHRCHVRWRVNELPRARSLERLLDLEHEMPDDARAKKLGAVLQKSLAPFVARFSGEAALKALSKRDDFNDTFIVPRARRYLTRG